MTMLNAIILGLVQGLTEFIPVSSSGHLLVASEYFNLGGTFEFETVLNIGTILAALIYFRKDLVREVDNFRSKKSSKLLTMILIAAFPVMLVGLVLGIITTDGIRSETLTIVALIVVGIIMLFEGKFSGQSSNEEPNRRQSLLIGLAQVAALVPGVSRSASTIMAGRAVGLGRIQAARFSFLLSLPVVGAATLYVLAFNAEQLTQFSGASIAAGVLSSFVSSILAIHLLLKVVQKLGLAPFGAYRILLGVVLLFLL